MYSVILEAAESAVDFAKVSDTVLGKLGSYLAGRFSDGLTGPDFIVFIILGVIGCILVPYLLGSVNSGIIFSRLFHKEDIRAYGSGNAGTTNMLRTYGKRDAAITLAGDIAKGALSVLAGRLIFGLSGGFVALFCVIVGHAFPVFYKFKGGKGVACAAGGVAVLYAGTPRWYIILIELAIFAAVVAISKFISLGSVTAMFIFPLLVARLNIGLIIDPFLSIMVAALVIWLHRSNIKRIYRGTESKLSFSKTDKHEKTE